MKRLPAIILVFFIFLSCDENKSKDAAANTPEDGKEMTDQKKIQQTADEVEKQKAALEKMTPVSTEQLEALIPENLLGAERIKMDVKNSMGAGLAIGEYQLNDSTRFAVNIYDCGGPAGAGIYSMQFLGIENMLHENEEEYTKAIDFNGLKAYEQCDKATNDCTLTYFAGGRYLVSIEGINIGAEKLKQAAGELKLK